ncbi:Uncharacterized protein T310_8713, partial [Rasamsonia emersonii CBS 393.64]
WVISSQASALTTYALPLTSNASPVQTFKYTLSKPGQIPSRQDAPHPHAVFLDPSGGFLVSPDLGADVVRVYAISTNQTVDSGGAVLHECAVFPVKAGDGPRHGVFWSSTQTNTNTNTQTQTQQSYSSNYSYNYSNTTTLLYIVNELANTVTAYTVSYNDSSTCLSLSPNQVITPYPNGTSIPETANVAGIHVLDKNLYVSVRNDHAFPSEENSDSMATLAISDETGELSFSALTPSFGQTPRTFAINVAGDLVAIGDQVSSNVAVVKRDPRTGKLGPLVASLRVGTPGKVGESSGLSSVVWGE